MVKCISCNYDGIEIVSFECPKCNQKINRCMRCKNLSIEYKCEKCGFRGP